MAKRVFLLLVTNILVVATITLILGVLGVGNYFPRGGLAGLAVFCLAWGFGGAFISLAISRFMAKHVMGVKVIPPEVADPQLRELVQTVHALARQAGLPKLPEVGVYQSPEINAFATGPTRSRSLVAVSTGLLERMRDREVEGVLGHEIAHVANGDMVTMTLIQGVINAFVMFLSRALAFAISQALSRRDDRSGGGGGMFTFLLVMVFQVVFGILGSMVVAAFSRWREFHADAGGARLAGRENMIGALQALKQLNDPRVLAAEAQRAPGFQAFKISGAPGGLAALLATHPPIEKRIARLQEAR